MTQGVEGGFRRPPNRFWGVGASGNRFCGIVPFNPNKKGASRISGRAVCFSLLLPDYQIAGGNYDMISNFIFVTEPAG
jgi:hypothetical protein